MKHVKIIEIDKINRLIETQAEEAQWEKVLSLSQDRHKLINDFIENNKATLEQSIISDIQKSTLASDTKVKLLVSQQKHSITQSILSLQNSYKAIKEYRTTRNTSANS